MTPEGSNVYRRDFRLMIDAGGITRGGSNGCGEVIGLPVRPLNKLNFTFEDTPKAVRRMI